MDVLLGFRVKVVAAEVGNRLEVGLEVAQQPDHLDVAVGLGFEAAAGSDPIEITIYIKLQQMGGCVAGTAGVLRLDTDEPVGGEVEPVCPANFGSSRVWARS